MHLVDYKVRVINSEAATAAGVRVVIESRDDHDVWGTVGVSENIIEASWTALVDSFEYKLCKDETRGEQPVRHRVAGRHGQRIKPARACLTCARLNGLPVARIPTHAEVSGQTCLTEP